MTFLLLTFLAMQLLLTHLSILTIIYLFLHQNVQKKSASYTFNNSHLGLFLHKWFEERWAEFKQLSSLEYPQLYI